MPAQGVVNLAEPLKLIRPRRGRRGRHRPGHRLAGRAARAERARARARRARRRRRRRAWRRACWRRSARRRAAEQPLMRLGLASVAAYPDFVAELSEVTGMDTGYLRCGTLLSARDRDEAEALERELELREGLGLHVQRLRPSQARALEPALAPTLRLALDDPRRSRDRPAQADPGARAGAPQPAASCGRQRRERIDDCARARERDHARRRLRRPGGERCGRRRPVVERARWHPRPAHVSPIHPIKGQILRLHDPAGPGPAHARAAHGRRLRGAARGRALRDRRDDGGARVRHDGDRRRRVRAAARRLRAAAVG